MREETNARAASAVVLDPQTGEILAMASVPTFDPNSWSDASAEARRCRPIADAYEPGSTFKVITAAAAIEAGTIGPDDIIDCGGGSLTIGRTTIHEHGRAAWGALPLVDVLAHSSNVGAAHIGLGMGKAAFHRAVRAFGFGQKTGVDLEGENGGLLRDPSTWSALSLPTISFGQEIGVNALQLARAFAAIANGGILPTPYLVAEIARPGSAPERRAPPAGPRVISERTAAAMRRLLVKVVEEGTGRKAAVAGLHRRGEDGDRAEGDPRGRLLERPLRRVLLRLPPGRPAARGHRRPRRRAARADLRRRRRGAGLRGDRGRGDARPRRAGPPRGGPRDAVDPDGRPLARGRSRLRARCRPGSFRRPSGRRRSPRTSTSSPRARGSSRIWPAGPPERPFRSWRSAASP